MGRTKRTSVLPEFSHAPFDFVDPTGPFPVNRFDEAYEKRFDGVYSIEANDRRAQFHAFHRSSPISRSPSCDEIRSMFVQTFVPSRNGFASLEVGAPLRKARLSSITGPFTDSDRSQTTQFSILSQVPKPGFKYRGKQSFLDYCSDSTH